MTPVTCEHLPPASERRGSRVGTALRRFDSLVSIAERLLDSHSFAASAACAQLAARHAFTDHPGIFASRRLEEVLVRLGCVAVPPATSPVSAQPGTGRVAVLHVLTYARPVGGDTRFVWRWIASDPGRRHSVVVTKQGSEPPPAQLTAAVAAQGGTLRVLERPVWDLLGQAAELRHACAQADLVVLHLFPDDIVPVVALSDARITAPVVFVNHSDHTFWVGVGVTDTLAQLRETPYFPVEARRGIGADRHATLPIPLTPCRRQRSAEEAKRRLGYGPDTTILLTVASAFKFERTDENCGFLELVLPALDQHPHAILLAIGPPNAGEWAAAARRTNGRVVPLGRRTNVEEFYEAADIYLDPYPFASITSMLEAGTRQLPLVAYTTGDDRMALLSSGAPGLDPVVQRASSPGAYRALLDRLITDPAHRRGLGRETAEAIANEHTGAGWERHLTGLYQTAQLRRHQVRAVPTSVETPSNDDLDHRLHTIVNRLSIGLGPLVDTYFAPLPYPARWRALARLLVVETSFSWTMFLPHALERLLQGRLGWVRVALRNRRVRRRLAGGTVTPEGSRPAAAH